MTTEIWLQTEEACSLLNISRETLRRNCKAGKYIYKTKKSGRFADYSILLGSLSLRDQNRYYSENKFPILEEKSFSYDLDLNLDLYNKAPDWAKKKADKYMKILLESKDLYGKDLKDFIKSWNQKNPSLKTSYARLMAARKTYEESGISGLLAQYGQNKGKNKVDDQCFEYFKSLYLLEGSPSGYSCWLMTIGYAKETLGMDIADFPSLSSFKRRLSKELPQQTIYIARHGEAAWNRKYGMYID